MRINRVLNIMAAILSLGTATGYSQSYYYSGAISGSVDADLSPYGWDGQAGYGEGGFTANFGTIAETLTYNAAAGTLREVGSITLNPSTASFNMSGEFDPFAPLPRSGGGVLGSATLNVGNNGSISFDTTFDARYGGNNYFGDIEIPVSGSGIYEGQSFNGSWDIGIPLLANVSTISPTSLTFSQSAMDAWIYGLPVVFVPVVNGALFCGSGSEDSINDSWDQEEIVATAVPETNSTFLLLFETLLLGSGAVRLLHKKSRT